MNLARPAFRTKLVLLIGSIVLCWPLAYIIFNSRQIFPSNLILITLGNVAVDEISCYGDSSTRMPALNRLAHKSLQYQTVYSVATDTPTALISLLTGLAPSRHRVSSKTESAGQEPLPSLARELEAHGYRTAALSTPDAGIDWPQWGLPEADSNGLGAGDVERLFASSETWLRAQTKRPFFLWVHYENPSSSLTDETGATPTARSPRFRATSRNVLDRLDAGMGRLLRTLVQCGFERRTIIVLTGTHGPLPESGLQNRLTTLAEQNFETAFRAPLLIHVTGGVDHAILSGGTVSSLDVTATLYLLLGFQPPKALDGEQVFEPVVRSSTVQSACNSEFYDNSEKQRYQCLTDYPYRLIRKAIQSDGETAGVEKDCIIDLRKGSDGAIPAAAAPDEVIARLHEKLARFQ